MSLINQVLRDLDARGSKMRSLPTLTAPIGDARAAAAKAHPLLSRLGGSAPRQTGALKGSTGLPRAASQAALGGLMVLAGALAWQMNARPDSWMPPRPVALIALPVTPAMPADPAPVLAAIRVEDMSAPSAGVAPPAKPAPQPPAAVTASAVPPASPAALTALPAADPVAVVATVAMTTPTTEPLGLVEKKMTPLSVTQRAQASHAAAVESAQTGRPAQALAQAREALRIDPGLVDARALAAVLWHEAGNTEQAIDALRVGLTLDPRAESLAWLLARLQAHQGNADAALGTLDRYQLHSTDAEALRAGLANQLRQFKVAVTAYQALLQKQPEQVNAWLGLGVALEGDGQVDAAREVFLRTQAMGLADPELRAFVTQRLKAMN